ncbi:MAG TPA: site-specific DNA-methyltransferase [Candidatus Onthousia faecipullorum]|uniref:Methyltransferase n=1 Tax=Candidatus Onthousia faecipullorum TaxID=2840887 RepID=A0A9D1GBY3_9FIRM|nr:site-specific DNA-methyltransferase [Candidatus Onthousia faecipullorum]
MEINKLYNGDSIQLIKELENDSIHLILSDIPYGIGYEDWDVLHNNTNSAFLGSSKAQEKAGGVFKRRGKPLNGWSEADKKIPFEYQEWCSTWASEWLRVLKPGASVFIFAGRRMSHRCICAMEESGFIFRDMIAWEKDSAPHRAQRISEVYKRRNDTLNEEKWAGWRVGNLRPIFEPILWFQKPYKLGATLADNVINHEVGAFNDLLWNKYTINSQNIIKTKKEKSDHGLHPTQKPLSLMNALIELTTKPGQIVLDPFMGSGSTCVSAKLLGRKYIGFELDKNYYEIAVNRIKEINIQEKMDI